MNAPVKLTHDPEVVPSGCHWDEPAWAALTGVCAGRVNFAYASYAAHHGRPPAT